MSSDWAQAFFDATGMGTPSLHVQAAVDRSSDLSWLRNARDFARSRYSLRPLLDHHEGELKSDLYFAIVNSTEARQYTALLEELHRGPRQAHILLYHRAAFFQGARQALGVTEADERRSQQVKRAVQHQAGIDLVNTSPIAVLPLRLSQLGLPGYRPLLAPHLFDPSAITHKYHRRYRPLVHVAARMQAVFGDLSILDPNPANWPLLARQSLLELVRSDYLFDADFEQSLTEVMSAMFEVEWAADPLGDRARWVRVEEADSKHIDGIQACDVAAGVARAGIHARSRAEDELTEEAIGWLVQNFAKVSLHGVRLV